MEKEKKKIHPISISTACSERITDFKNDQGRNFSNSVEFIVMKYFKEIDKKK